mmetsp:Transcript_32823/g.78533  ORF Transcript_32823/g.78533 Transcript_32823/m.78533 type:complete len:329 (-) Transcript_32823:88-1074(-)
MKLLLLQLPMAWCLQHQKSEGTPPVDGAVAFSMAPSRDLPKKFTELADVRFNGTKLEYMRCDPRAPPGAQNERCVPFKQELHFTPRPLKLVLGVMAMSAQKDIHEAHRNTWMKKPGVCPLSQHGDARCHVFPVFIFGDISDPSLDSKPDVVLLKDVPEPPQIWDGFEDTKHGQGWQRSWWTSQFKTPAWMSFASEHYPWASHIGKMDSDTFPDILTIQEDLDKAPVTAGGREWPVIYGRHFMGGYNGKGGMYGEFYSLSRSLVNCFLKADQEKTQRQDVINGRNTTWGAEWWDHAEDQVLRTTLFHAEENHICPEMLDANSNRWKHPV